MMTPINALLLAALVASPTAVAPAPASPDCFPDELINFTFAPSEATGLDENYRSRIIFSPGARAITRVVWERENASADWEETQTEHSVSYDITAVGFCDGGDTLYLAGIKPRTCDDIIEKWTFPRSTGAIAFRASPSATTTPPVPPIGQPAPGVSLGSSVTGGTYVPPSGRGAGSGPVREVIYEGSALGHIRSMAADPQGRYLLLQSHGDSGIYQLDLMTTPIGAPTLVYSASGSTALVAVRRMMVYDLPSAGGRAFILSAPQGDVLPPDAPWALVTDLNNDGIMDTFEDFTAAQWLASSHSDRTTWQALVYADGFDLGY